MSPISTHAIIKTTKAGKVEDTLNRIYFVRLPCLINVEKCLLTVKHANGIATVMRSYSLLPYWNVLVVWRYDWFC